MKRQKVFAVLPTLLTLANAACGFGAITIAARVGPDNFGGSELFIASVLIFLAMLFDMLDGSAARWAKQTSEFGAELDSLCDAISFGVAPAFLMLQFAHPQHHLVDSLGSSSFTYDPRMFWLLPRMLWVIALLFVLCAVLRLARFNVETDDDDSHEFFSGLPSPAAAGTVAAFPIAVRGLQNLAMDNSSRALSIAEWLIPAIAISMPLITLGVACLMVSKIRYPHVFNQLFRGQRSRTQVLQLVFTLALVFLVREMAVPVIFCYFAFGAPLRALYREVVGDRLQRSVGT